MRGKYHPALTPMAANLLVEQPRIYLRTKEGPQ